MGPTRSFAAARLEAARSPATTGAGWAATSTAAGPSTTREGSGRTAAITLATVGASGRLVLPDGSSSESTLPVLIQPAVSRTSGRSAGPALLCGHADGLSPPAARRPHDAGVDNSHPRLINPWYA